MYFVYAIYNQVHDKIYIGQTKDLDERIEFHNKKIFKGYTSRFDGGWQLVYSEQADTRQQALIREKQLKSYQGRQFIRKMARSGVAQR